MKARTGFVSNSSSTSFTLFGVCLSDWREAEDLASMTGLHTIGGDPNGWAQRVYVGLVLAGDFEHSQCSHMRDDETKAQFVERVKSMFPENFREEADWHSESFYDG